ncbi:HEAT repeat containing 1 homolog l(2)k09022 [Leptinotarsa decemlineata]|uniref:HEAT repeat containing 1 homolog l(2)k09022 n=1 Tax=Leptinotarsa decemlineata TaxID=7539 RepID=UPI003D305E52
MSTSLAEQLQNLALPQTTAIKRDKKRASLLFDPKEAAGLKRETVYQIGLEGLEELIQKNEVFQQFHDSLFHLTAKDFERSIQTAEANEKLDKHIRKFLCLLSPYFLLNCSHKALEWMINRYSIHEYNREDLLMLCLPYHESNIFVRLIQLVKIKDSRDSFYFLKALQKTGAHLPKQSLLNHAASNSGFLKFVSKYITQLLKHHDKPNLLTVAFNFACTVFLGALEYSDTITEDQVSQMLPLLLKGLNSPIADFCAVSYVVTSMLVTKTTLSAKLLDKFVEKISELKVNGLKSEACLILVIIYQAQKHYKQIPPSAVGNLSEREWLPKELHLLNSSGCLIYPFLELIGNRFTEEGIHNDLKLARDMVTNCLNQLKLEESFVGSFLNAILDATRPKMDISEEARSWLVDIVQALETQYPTPFDKEVYKILSSTSDKKSTRKRKCLMKILKGASTYQGKFNIFEKLYNPNPVFREEALKYLLDNYEILRETDREIIISSFADRLKDDKVEVIGETLSLLQETPKINKAPLKNVLIQLAYKCLGNASYWEPVAYKVAELLGSSFEANDWQVFLVLFPYLLPRTNKSLGKCRRLVKSSFFSDHELFKSKINTWRSTSDATSFCEVSLEAVASNTDLDKVKEFLYDALKQLPMDKYRTFHLYIALVISSNLLPHSSSLEIGELLVKLSIDCVNSSWNKDKEESSVPGQLALAASGKVPLLGVLQCIENTVHKMKKPDYNLSLHDFHKTDADEGFFLRLTSFLIGNIESYETVLKEYLNGFCDDSLSQVDFLLNLCTSESEVLEESFKKQVLTYLKNALKADKEENWLIDANRPTTVFSLVLLCDPDEEIRNLVFELINLFIESSAGKSFTYIHLLESITKYKEEILTDCDQMPLVLFNILDPQSEKKGSQWNAIQDHLLEKCCSSESPVYLKAGILKMMSHINSFEILESVAEVALEILRHTQGSIDSFSAKIIGYALSRIEASVMKKLGLDTVTWNFLETGIKDDRTVVINEEGDKMCLSHLVLNQLEKECFEVLDDSIAEKLLNVIVEIASTTQNPEVPPAASRIFKHIDLDANLILSHLTRMRDIQSPKVDQAKKKRRVSVIPTVDILDLVEWKKGVTVLEFIQDKKKIRNSDVLMQVLFDLLKRCLNFDEQAAVEYPKQLLLSSILHCCSKTEHPLPENVFNMEVIVQCIRASQNPQTHHHALLLLAHTANLFPTQVLHHMMAIFTFMGSSVLRHDDAYSFQIISKIIDTIVPILVKDNNEGDIAKVLRVFVDAILDVPEHRRMPLYKQLLDNIDPKENLYLFLLVVVEAQVLHSSEEKQKNDKTQRRLVIAADLCVQFPPETVLYTAVKMLDYVRSLPEEKEDAMEVDAHSGTFDVSAQTPKDFRHYKYLLLKFLTTLLSSSAFVNQVATLRGEEELALEPLLKEMIVKVLQFVQKISKVVDKSASGPQAHYWKVILHLGYDILDSINALVTAQMFLLVTKGLMVHTLPTVRRRILELLNMKLQYNSQFFADCEKSEIYTLIPPIISIVETIDEGLEPEQEIIIQTALLSLKLLVKSLASVEPEKFVILEFITTIIRSGKAKNNVLASVVLCLAELCVSLKGYAIASLPEFMPAITKILKLQKHEESSSVLLRSTITTIEKILDSMPLFLSPYLEKLLVEVSILLSKWDASQGEQKTQSLVGKLSSIKQKIGSMIPLRVLLPSVEHCYDRLIGKHCYKATSALMDVLCEGVANLKGADINSNLPELTSFFLNALKFRSESECTLDDTNLVESHVVKAFKSLILKLSENTFRPLYYKLYDWAIRSEVKSERLITFYNLSAGVAQSLKGIFVLFAGHFINNAAQTLDSCNTAKSEELFFSEDSKTKLLLERVLGTLDAVFLYDSQKFVNRERFDILMQPLVDQLENSLGGIEELVERNTKLLTPCIVHFAVAAADDSLWKQMNYQILLKMRNNTPKIRLVALHCLTEIVKKLGEDFLPLLPETIPFLSELLEDEEEDVEKACQKAVQEMEKVLGEPLQKYF